MNTRPSSAARIETSRRNFLAPYGCRHRRGSSGLFVDLKIDVVADLGHPGHALHGRTVPLDPGTFPGLFAQTGSRDGIRALVRIVEARIRQPLGSLRLVVVVQPLCSVVGAADTTARSLGPSRDFYRVLGCRMSDCCLSDEDHSSKILGWPRTHFHTCFCVSLSLRG